jgi:hypothetical protein
LVGGCLVFLVHGQELVELFDHVVLELCQIRKTALFLHFYRQFTEFVLCLLLDFLDLVHEIVKIHLLDHFTVFLDLSHCDLTLIGNFIDGFRYRTVVLIKSVQFVSDYGKLLGLSILELGE